MRCKGSWNASQWRRLANTVYAEKRFVSYEIKERGERHTSDGFCPTPGRSFTASTPAAATHP